MTATRTADGLLDLLADIALHPGTAEPTSQVCDLAWRGHGPESLTAAWQEFRRLVADREALATGTKEWADIDPCASCLESAILRLSARIHEAFRLLAYGPVRGSGSTR